MTNLRSLALACLALLALASCSSGGKPAAGSNSEIVRDLDLVVNTSGAAEAKLVGRISVVALERADGEFTANLLDGDLDLVLADPAGEASFARMRNAPAGTYVAVNLAFSTTRVQAQPRSGEPFVVELPRRDFRVLLSQPMTLASAAQAWFTLVHEGPITLERSGEQWTWNPTWVAQPSEAQLLRGARAQVASFDQSRRLIDALLAPAATPVVLDLTRATTLLREGALLDLDQFFAALQVGEQITFDGWLDEWRNIAVVAAWIDTDRGARGAKSEVRGEIVELQPQTQSFTLLVQEIRKDRAGLPSERPLRLSVTVGERTRIKWLPRLGRHRGHLPYSALQVGMRVDVEWHGPAAELRLTAHKVDILEANAQPALRDVAATVERIDTTQRTITLRARGNGVWIGGERVTTFTANVTDDTLLVQRSRNRLSEIELAEVPVGAAAEGIVRIEGEVVTALFLRVRARD